MDSSVSSRALKSSEQLREQQRAFAEAARRELAGAWLAIRPRRRLTLLQEIPVQTVDIEDDQPPSV